MSGRIATTQPEGATQSTAAVSRTQLPNLTYIIRHDTRRDQWELTMFPGVTLCEAGASADAAERHSDHAPRNHGSVRLANSRFPLRTWNT